MDRCPTNTTGYNNPGPCGPAPCTGECRMVEEPTYYPPLHDVRDGLGDSDPWGEFDDEYYAQAKP